MAGGETGEALSGVCPECQVEGKERDLGSISSERRSRMRTSFVKVSAFRRKMRDAPHRTSHIVPWQVVVYCDNWTDFYRSESELIK